MTSISASRHPSSRARLAERILQPQAFLVADDLVRCRLTNIDYGMAIEMGLR